MGVKYVKDFSFDSGFGFTGSNNAIPVRPHMRKASGGAVSKGGSETRNPISKFPKLSKAMVGKLPANAGGKTPNKKFEGKKIAKYAKGGHVKKYAEGGDVAPTKILRPPPAPLTVTPKQGATEEELARLRDALERNNPGRKPDHRDYALPVESAPLPPLSPISPPPQETFGPAPIETLDPAPIGRLNPLPPEEYARPVQDYPRLRPQFDLESQEQTNARLAADRDMRRQNRMDMVGGRGEMGRRRMPMSPLQAAAAAPRPPMSNEQKARQIMDRYIAGPRTARRMPVAEPASMVNPREMPMYAKGGMVKKGAAKVGKVMGEFKRGELHSGSKRGPVVTNPKQAKAIALSEARKAGPKVPVKKAMGGKACG